MAALTPETRVQRRIAVWNDGRIVFSRRRRLLSFDALALTRAFESLRCLLRSSKHARGEITVEDRSQRGKKFERRRPRPRKALSKGEIETRCCRRRRASSLVRLPPLFETLSQSSRTFSRSPICAPRIPSFPQRLTVDSPGAGRAELFERRLRGVGGRQLLLGGQGRRGGRRTPCRLC